MGLNLTSEPVRSRTATPDGTSSPPPSPPTSSSAASERKYVGIKFNCCSVYVRVYANREGTAYEGRCPKCGKPVRLKIGEGGTTCRFFEAN